MQAFSGRVTHHRLNCGGDRRLNRSLYIITMEPDPLFRAPDLRR